MKRYALSWKNWHYLIAVLFFVIQIIVLLSISARPAHAAPFGIRFVTQPPGDLSSASRFTVQAQLYDLADGSTVFTSGVTITLHLYRCPGYPAACSVVTVENNFATASTSSGTATFNNLVITDDLDDYYFAAAASGYSSGVSTVFDVEQAVLRLETAPTGTVSTVSRLDYQAVVRIGTDVTDPVDLRADNFTVRMALYRCPGYPAACTVITIDNNFANVTMMNGTANFDDLVIDTAAADYYFATSTPSTSGIDQGFSPVFDVVQAHLRWSIDTPDTASSLSRMDLQVEVLIGPGGERDLNADSVPIQLALYRCPGYPGACTVITISTNYANASAINGAANFSNVVVGTPNTDHYFFATTPGEVSTGDGSNVFDVVQAALRWSIDIDSDISNASRVDAQVSIHTGTAADAPVDLDADSVPVRLALYRCSGYPGACTVVTISTNYVNASATNGVANFNDIVIETVNDDYYFFASTPGEVSMSGGSAVFNVLQAVASVENMIYDQVVGGSIPFTVSIRRGTAIDAPIDTLADGVAMRLALYRCPGYPGACTVITIDTDYANATMSDGIVSFPSLSIGTAATDYYFFATATNSPGVVGDTSSVFDVLNPATLNIRFGIQGRPSPPSSLLAVPVDVMLIPASGAPVTNTTVTANSSGEVQLTNVVPGTYTVWIKYARALALREASVVVNSGANLLIMGEMMSGDANDSNTVSIPDFSILATSFGLISTQPGYDARADFNGDNAVSIADFSLLATNFGTSGPVP